MDNELKHFGVKGMKWGVRRYQNKDGSLTEAGKKRYNKLNIRDVDSQMQKNYDSAKLLLGGIASINAGTLLSVPLALTGNLPAAAGVAYIGAVSGTGMTIGAMTKYYRDGHKYVHKYD